MTAKQFKSYGIVLDPELEELLGPVAKKSLTFSPTTGRIGGRLRWKVVMEGASGRPRNTTVTGNVAGIMLNGTGYGTVEVRLNRETLRYGIMFVPVVGE